MQKNSKLFLVALALAWTFSFTSCKEDDPYVKKTIDFQSVTLNDDGYWNGSDGSGSLTIDMATFNNEYNDESGAWSGFAFSNNTDIETPGFSNQYSAYIPAGADASNAYAVSYVSGDVASITASITFLTEVNILSAEFTNSTYAYFTILNGDAFTDPFKDGDWFELTVVGFDAAGEQVDEVTYRLADYTNGSEFIAESWTEVDLRPLKGVTKLVFNLESTDVGDWGMNTPAYFCMDNLRFEYLK